MKRLSLVVFAVVMASQVVLAGASTNGHDGVTACTSCKAGSVKSSQLSAGNTVAPSTNGWRIHKKSID
jgi:hypothetical protein